MYAMGLGSKGWSGNKLIKSKSADKCLFKLIVGLML